LSPVVIQVNDIIEGNYICHYRTLDTSSFKSAGATKVITYKTNVSFYFYFCNSNIQFLLYAVSDTGIGSSLEEFQNLRVSFTNAADNWGN